MSESELKLACLLASYEMDEPHNSTPDLDVGDEKSQHYANVTPERFSAWLLEEHCGDCTKMPAPCIRCFADTIAHKARWIAAIL